MKNRIADLLKLPTPLPLNISQAKANCFNAVQFYFEETDELIFLSAQNFVNFIRAKFEQISNDNEFEANDLVVLWSRDISKPHSEKIKIDNLKKSNPGYPFGLIMEHAFVIIENNRVFQKRGPTPGCPYEIISVENALEPYLNRHGFEKTLHRLI